MWQFACREEHIPRVGDHTVYEIAGRSYVIMRSAADTIKAFPNACLHRGRQLKQYDGNCSEIRCPFHGFAWNLDGTLKDVPAHWDLPHVTADALRASPRSRSARGTGSSSSTPIPMPSRSPTTSRSWPPTSIAGTSAIGTSRPMSRR